VIEITGTVTGADEVARRFENASAQIRLRVRQVVQGLGIELQRKVKEEKLSGQVLRVQSGRLRRSVNEQTTESGDVVESTVGTPVVYGRFWELGFDGAEQVKAHTRTAHGVVQQVRAHSRTVHQAARPFLQPALAEMKDRIVERLSSVAVVP